MLRTLGRVVFTLALLCAVAVVLAAASTHHKKWKADDYITLPDGRVVPDTFTSTSQMRDAVNQATYEERQLQYLMERRMQEDGLARFRAQQRNWGWLDKPSDIPR